MKLSDEEIFEFIKCAEELNELSAVLIQQVTKPKKNLRKRILSEIGDTLYRMWPIINLFDEDEVELAVKKNEKKQKN
tara:strand:+ start:389 stop:619 length:231 start_codon:yes stop_codon:yes gene_type:complete